MSRQSFYFVTERAVRLEFHVRADLSGITVESLFNPPREPDHATFEDAAAAADAMEERVKFHLEEYPAVLGMIRIRHDLAPLTYEHLGRFGVPLIPME